MKKIREILLFSLCVLLFSGSLTAAAADGAPIAENLEIMTYRGISVGGQLKAFDPEGEEVHFRITTEPRKGTLTLEENGEFVYTPAEGKRGRDYFGYCASDPKGNVSQEATVVITIRKAGKGAGYADTARSLLASTPRASSRKKDSSPAGACADNISLSRRRRSPAASFCRSAWKRQASSRWKRLFPQKAAPPPPPCGYSSMSMPPCPRAAPCRRLAEPPSTRTRR